MYLVFLLGSEYSGHYENGVMHGQGTFRWPDGREFTGQFKDDKRNGTGSYKLLNGDVVVGEFKEAKMHGKMVRTTSSGEVYEEMYIDDVFQSSVQVSQLLKISLTFIIKLHFRYHFPIPLHNCRANGLMAQSIWVS